ncbi:signal peptidase II [Thioflexithrix psekupsensis]|uniref:Lipoprotein signal peptidase n=1 Tax=Thioflexithrix psekupsensis TaxID=1570016 RepID=A0A251X686_9GAMM|nr:signal peptidase II [Thioflexithrix psekupsensis]OUD13107.1 signal peptidase II [Thioflexithrix psekupsensis]
MNASTHDTQNTTGLRWLWISFIVLLLDQATKWWASSALELYQPVPVLPYLNFTLLHNPGAAFSFLADAGGWQRWFFTGLAVVISAVIVMWLARLSPQQRMLGIALALVLGGAVGNVIDRFIYGYVIDFIDVYYQTWHWPAFNIADSAITIGAVLLLIDVVRHPQPTES